MNNSTEITETTKYPSATLEQDEWNEFVESGLPFLVYLSILLFLGTFGNVATIFIYYTKKPSSNCRTFILWLAVVDLLSCVIGIPEYIYRERYSFSYKIDEICKTFVFLHFFLSCYSVLILDLIAVERYMKTCKMFGKQLSSKEAKLICFCLSFVSIGFAIYPSIELYGIAEVIGPSSGLVGQRCTLTNISKGQIFFGVFGFVNIFGIGFSVTFYVLIYRMLQKHKQENIDILKIAPLVGQGTIKKEVSKSLTSLQSQGKQVIKAGRSVDNIVQNGNGEQIYLQKMKIDSAKTTVNEYHDDTDDEDKEDDSPCISERSLATGTDSIGGQSLQNVRTNKPNIRQVSKLSIISTSDVMLHRIKTLKKSVKMTMVFFVATVFTYITVIPYIVVMCIASIDIMCFYQILEFLRPFTYIFLYLHLTNFVINPFVYCFLDTDFRYELKNLFTKRSRKPNSYSVEY